MAITTETLDGSPNRSENRTSSVWGRIEAYAPKQSHAAVELGAWIVCATATILAGFLLWNFRITVDLESLFIALSVMTFLVSVHVVYGRWRPAPVLRNLCGALAVIAWSAAMAGIISLIGLRYQSPLVDSTLASLDRVADIDVPWLVEWSAAHPFWAQLLDAAYRSSYTQLFTLTILLAVRSRAYKLWQLTLVFAITIVASTTISIFWPAKGAFAYFNYPSDILDRLPAGAGVYHLQKFEYFRYDPSPILSFANLQGVVTFPSFHCCLALMTIFATWGTRWLFAITLVWNALVIASTLPIGGHYAIDLPFGALLWLVATVTAKLVSEERNALFARLRATVRMIPAHLGI